MRNAFTEFDPLVDTAAKVLANTPITEAFVRPKLNPLTHVRMTDRDQFWDFEIPDVPGYKVVASGRHPRTGESFIMSNGAGKWSHIRVSKGDESYAPSLYVILKPTNERT